jgi:hypothetical protein
MVLLPDFSHVEDEYTLQQTAWERLITSYLDTGVGDDSLYVYQPLPFKAGVSTTILARALVAAMIVLPALILLGTVALVRRIRRGRKVAA